MLNATSDDAGGLDVVIFLADGAAVILTSNLWQEVGLCNGVTGVVEDLLFHPDRPPPCQPIAALVHFTNYTGPAFLTTNPKTVPIPPHLFEWESDGKAEKAAGSSFVAISRVRSLQNLVLQPVSFQRLEAIGKRKQLQERLREEERLRNLAKVTTLHYEHLKSICEIKRPTSHGKSLFNKPYTYFGSKINLIL